MALVIFKFSLVVPKMIANLVIIYARYVTIWSLLDLTSNFILTMISFNSVVVCKMYICGIVDMYVPKDQRDMLDEIVTTVVIHVENLNIDSKMYQRDLLVAKWMREKSWFDIR